MKFDDGISGLYSGLYENRREAELSLADILRHDWSPREIPQRRSTQNLPRKDVDLRIFMSYDRPKDLFGAVSEFRRRLQNEIRMRLSARIFLDTLGIRPGDRWQARLKNEIKQADAFVALTSPAWFNSKWGVWEYTQFCQKEAEAGRAPRVLGVTWVRCLPEMRQRHPIALQFATLQECDWSDLRHDPIHSPQASRSLDNLADAIINLANLA